MGHFILCGSGAWQSANATVSELEQQLESSRSNIHQQVQVNSFTNGNGPNCISPTGCGIRRLPLNGHGNMCHVGVHACERVPKCLRVIVYMWRTEDGGCAKAVAGECREEQYPAYTDRQLSQG